MLLLSTGPLASPYAYAACVVAIVLVLAALVAWATGAVLKKARPEDVPEALVGLSHVFGALSCFLPWGKWRNLPREVQAASGTLENSPGFPAPTSPTIITASQIAVAPLLPERTASPELPASRGGNGR
ncbi:hypothetical protein ACFC1D_04190 [Streptomyces vinaceus]|uniref:hypothetical protein n=1 Tax=Streptomyces vinaceus TaxID=1960 RepID=UPI0035DE1195